MHVDVRTTGRGVLLPGLRLALDAAAPGHATVVSHAHSDHVPQEATEVHASLETADLLALRYPHLRVHVLAWRTPVRVGHATVRLHPAGHILGSALVHVTAPDGETLLYTGDTKTRTSRTCAPAQYAPADVLVIESTFGLPVFHLPPAPDVEARMVRFARDTLAEGNTPVLLAYSLGKAQEVLHALGESDVPAVAHGAAYHMCQVYERHGVSFPTTRPYDADALNGAALVVPPQARTHPMVLRLDARVGHVSGWARLARSRAQRDADELLPLSDHADFPGLLDIVARVKPRRILTNHGYADAFAHILRRAGHDAAPLSVGHAEEDVDQA